MIDEARVQVVVSFPTITLSMADAYALRAGQVINFGVSLAEAQMAVKVAGVGIGIGQLMVVDTHAGVMLMRLGS